MTNPYGFEDIDCTEMQRRVDEEGATIIDCRESWEYEMGHIPGAILIPMGDIPGRLDEIPNGAVVVCASGNRSANVCAWLSTQGKENLANLAGGTQAWMMEGFDVER